MKGLNQALDKFCKDFLTLKKLKRTGWQLRGIKESESLADHCFGVVLLTHILCEKIPQKIDRNRAITIAIIHEIAESRVGDIPYTALRYFPHKSEMEQAAFKDIFSQLGQESLEKNLDLFEEFENNSSVEARLVRAIDKLEMLITAAEYEFTGFASLKDFWENDSTFECMKEFPEIYEYALSLKQNRSKRLLPND